MLDQPITVDQSFYPRILPEDSNHQKIGGNDGEINHSEPSQFARLYEKYVERIHHFIKYRLADEEAAKDLTDQVFLKALEKLGGYQRTNAPIIAWLYAIARNTVIDNHRTSREWVRLDDVTTLQSQEPSPAEECELRFENDNLHHAMNSLTAEQRQVIVYKFIEDLSTGEIARRLGKREGSVRALQMRALRTLSEQMRDHAEGLSPDDFSCDSPINSSR